MVRNTTTQQATSSDDAHMLRRLEQLAASEAVHQETTIHTTEDELVKQEAVGEVRLSDRLPKRRVSATIFVCVIFVALVGALMFASPVLVLINNKEQLTNDLNDGHFAYRTIAEKVLGAQIGGSMCGEESLKCKFHTMSPMLKERFERYKFTFDTTNEMPTKRYATSGMKFPDGTSARDGDAFAKARADNYKQDVLADKVYSLRNGLYQDRGFFVRLLERFGIEQRNTIGGSTRENYLKSFDERIADGDERYASKYIDDPDAAAEAAAAEQNEPQDYIDANGRGIYGLHTLANSSDRWLTDIYSNVMNKANTHMALACGFATYGNMMETALSRAKTVTMARYAMNYMAAADDVKSYSMNSNMDLAVDILSNKLLQPSDSGANAMDASTYEAPALGVLNETDSGVRDYVGMLTALTVMRPGGPSMHGTEYLQHGFDVVQSNAAGADSAAKCASGMSSAQESTEKSGLCYNPASVPLAGFIGAAASAVIVPAQKIIEPLCLASVKGVVQMIIEPGRADTTTLVGRLMSQAKLGSLQFTSDLSGEQAQHAIFAGTAAILGDRAQSLGMRPASQESYQSYLKLSQKQARSDDELQRKLARDTPWDASNPHSFIGSIVAKFFSGKNSQALATVSSGTATALRSIAVATQSVLPSAYANYTQPVQFSSNRLTHALDCALPTQMMSEISLDIACNVRYSMSQKELDMKVDDVISYMTQAHPNEAQESLGQIQGRDMGADAARGSRMQSQANEGANAAYVDSKTGAPNKYTEYAKFLEFCTNRYDPWGQTSMYVEQQDERYNEDKEIDSKRTSQGRTSNLLVDPRKDPTPESYYALGWGGAADQDWYTGKKCTDDSDMLSNFRVYTMMCAALAGMSGSRECWHPDTIPTSHDNFYTSNNIIFESSDY